MPLTGEQQIPHKQSFQHTIVGGLSGIDYDAGADTWILVTPFRQPNGESYSSRWKSGEIADVDVVRSDPRDNSIWYASEGERLRGLNPFIRRALRSGELIEG